MADLLSIGLSGLAASKTQLSITGHNITNVNTPGYSRQDASQATRSPQFSGAGYIGSGTSLVDVRRSYSEFLTSQLRSSTSLNRDVEAYKSQIDQLDSLLAGTTTGITPSLQKFFSALQTAAEDPANIPARQLVLAEAEGLARRFNTVYDRLSEQNNFTNKQMSAVTDQVNRLAGSIGSLNEAIAIAAANGKQPNDLLDARDEAVRQLSGYIGVTVVPQDDSSFNVFIGSGQPLVVGSTVAKLEVVPGQGDPNRHEVQFISGGSRQGITSQITGGELGGLIRYREEVLDSTMNSLGRLSLAVSDQVNTQLKQGLDLKGDVGVDLFKDINSADLVDKRSFPTGIDVSITDTSKLTASDYQVEFVSAGTFRIRPSGGAWLAGTHPVDSAIAELGFSISAPADPSVTSYTVMPTRRAASGIAVDLDQADQLAFAAPVRSEAELQNAGTGVIGQPDLLLGPSPISFTALQGVFGSTGSTLTFTADPDAVTIAGGSAQFRIVNNSTTPPTVSFSNTATVTPGQRNSLILEGGGYQFEFSLSGTPKDGDEFTMDFNQSGVSDNRNALKLVDLQSKQTVGVSLGADGKVISGVSFTDGYGELVERVGTLTAQARMDSEATGSILKQATDNRDSLSAVNLDEEAANLIKFEQYYNASAQIIQVARSLFDTLISSFR
ncbi:flagellar hook-associated protein FlgK [Stutzerimonas kunmingensis]|uniref:flagellar hook-associated protein FlgK n=2 Tax=Stutzerimonas kunmingensis TaxID=1211807 RepID=UPI00241CAC11|nr:flagellar hook-associated protein FlgK [Stutzerimonas kunmingensis]